ncbi:MAG: hypothetical protein IJR74_00950 [Paludibacteraceae bacterium]|nr:hypothetical protein [Paludibacteraceae bacterium]
MKKYLLSLVLLVAGIGCWAQDAEDLKSKVVIIPHIGITCDIPESASNLVMDKMKQVLLKNGIAEVTDRSRYVMTVKSNVTDAEWTETVPPKYAMTVELTFYVGDVLSGLLFSSKMFRRKAVAENEEKAYLQAVKQIKVSDPEFKIMLDKAKARIVESLDARDEPVELDGNGYNINWW